MHIGIVTHRVIREDGQGRVNLAVAEAALERGYAVTLLASEVDPALARHDRVRWVPIEVDPWPTELLRNQVFAWRSYRWLAAHRHKLDVIMANGCITWAKADVNAAHLVHSAWRQSPVHTSRVRRGPYAWYHWLYSALNAAWERFAFRQAEIVVAVSNAVRLQLLEAGVPKKKIRVISNGVDVDEFHPGPAQRDRLGLPDGVPLAFFAGDIQSPVKNLDTVLRALRYCPTLHLAVAGDDTQSRYPQMAEALDVAHRTHFLGFRSDVPDLMRAADFFVFPSHYESYSLVVVEAMASGLPVITARTVGAAQLVTSEAGVVLNDPSDVTRLARAMRALANDPNRRASMGAAARRIACRQRLDATADAYLTLFDEMAAAKPAVTAKAARP